MKRKCGQDFVLCTENLAGLAFFVSTNMLLLVVKTKSKKIKIVFRIIANNWSSITDPEEKSILEHHARSGRLITVIYYGKVLHAEKFHHYIVKDDFTGFIVGAAIFTSQVGLIVPLLDIIKPLNESREKILVIRAEYGFDPNEYYHIIYVMYTVAVSVACCTHAVVDTLFSVVMLQCIAIFSIMRLRLSKIQERSGDDETRAILVSVIKLHQKAHQLSQILTLFVMARK
ncbi:hypothetical protein QAD02_008728 [Eretmocerus hayati]|uniref:Uncharacterized protein n=1 Tax=Eretmocerus hayati TaxID=131215 RepID=A0ACC2N846_9HYME|nr:hypothetical protein QAD02_008728 [Eretmocerus hayati]